MLYAKTTTLKSAGMATQKNMIYGYLMTLSRRVSPSKRIYVRKTLPEPLSRLFVVVSHSVNTLFFVYHPLINTYTCFLVMIWMFVVP